MKAKLSGAALAVALLLTGCGDGAGNNVATANTSAPVPAIPAPNGGDWTQVVSRTPEGGVRIGNPNAPVKLVEYGSLTCPACRAFSEQGTQPLRDNYIRSGQVSWEFRHLIIHGASDVTLAMLVDCLPPTAFFRTIEQIYEQQAEILNRFEPAEQQALQSVPAEQQRLPIATAMELQSFFAQRGLPSGRLNQCLANNQAAVQLVANTDRATNEENVRGTPTFIINGEQQEASTWAALEPLLRSRIGN